MVTTQKYVMKKKNRKKFRFFFLFKIIFKPFQIDFEGQIFFSIFFTYIFFVRRTEDRTVLYRTVRSSPKTGALIKATLFDHMSTPRSRKLLGVRGPHFRVVLFGIQATCAGGYVHISDSIYPMLQSNLQKHSFE